jgi:ribosomal protein S18 acetylase RimI-like enzyme
VRDAGGVAAIARAAVDEGWVGITAVEVDPAHRRRGLGTHLLGALVRHGVGQGAHSAYLQTETTNTAARTLYERAGFAVHHTYRYVQAPA